MTAAATSSPMRAGDFFRVARSPWQPAFVAADDDVRVGGGVEVEFEAAGSFVAEDGVAVYCWGSELELVV